MTEETPAQRLARRTAFYGRVGGRWGDAELSFLRWEIARTVLDTAPSGSAWWRAVQATLPAASDAAELRVRDGQRDADDPAVAGWMAFLRKPSPRAFYRAHNATIVQGYLAYEGLAREESWGEQRFLEIVLYRVLYAQSLVDRDSPGCNPLPRWVLARFADPRTASVDVLVHLPDFYPRHYPLSPRDVKHILHQGFGVEEEMTRVLDRGLILPNAGKLFAESAVELGIPELRTLCDGDTPTYPRRVVG